MSLSPYAQLWNESLVPEPSVEARHNELLLAMEDKEQKLQSALAEATNKTKEVEVVFKTMDHARARPKNIIVYKALDDGPTYMLYSEHGWARPH